MRERGMWRERGERVRGRDGKGEGERDRERKRKTASKNASKNKAIAILTKMGNTADEKELNWQKPALLFRVAVTCFGAEASGMC